MYRESFGAGSFYAFLIGAFFVLYSTAFAATASNARLLADGAAVFKVVRYANSEHRAKAIKISVVVLMTLSVIFFMLWEQPVTLVFVGAVAQGIMLPFLAGAALYFRHRRLEPALRPGMIWTLCLWLAAILMAAAGLYAVVKKVMEVVGS
jgi:Mn2+/Fe2+ NRAMP family transporter